MRDKAIASNAQRQIEDRRLALEEKKYNDQREANKVEKQAEIETKHANTAMMMAMIDMVKKN